MKQQIIKIPLALTAILLMGIIACKKDPIDPTIPVPHQQPSPLPANALLKQIKWSETDHYTFSYNDQNQPLQLRNQWQFVQGDPTQIHQIVYDFQYNTQQRLRQVTQTGGITTRYFYQENLMQKIQDVYPGGVVVNETVYLYANGRIVQENYTVSPPTGQPPSIYKRILGYDDRGNLNKVETYEQKENMSFQLIQTNEYSDFDDKINVRNWLMRYPYLPQVRWQFNNPGKETIRLGEGLPKTLTYTYQYNAQGLPVSVNESRPGGALTAQFIYW